MILIPLQSGSAGNCLYVESGGTGLLIDAGIPASAVSERLNAQQIDTRSIAGVFITHEHADHIKCAGALGRKLKLPLYLTEPTYRRSARRMGLQDVPNLAHFKSGDSVRIGPFTVESVQTPHDAVDGVVFVIDDGIHRIGICTDFGHVFEDMKSLVKGVDGLFMEANYDVAMLANGRYPWALKKRISGPAGHISNLDAAELIASCASSRLQWLYAGHLSQENNRPDLALSTHRKLLSDSLPIHIAQRYTASERVELLDAKLRSSDAGGKAPFVIRKRYQPELFPGFS